VKESIPLARYGDVTDIAAAAIYLASADADYVTGTTLDVNGGLFMK
jgi:3-oxoacyl-[acyl-carrier protein] reductase